MSDTLNDRIDGLLAKMRAKTDYSGQSMEDAADDYHAADMVLHAALDDSTIETFCAVAKADDPEPPLFNVAADDWLTTDGEGYIHIAWRKRQELKAALYDALGKEEDDA